MLRRFTFVILLMLSALPAFAGSAEYRDFQDENLRYGKVVWLLNCETCHAYGVADAPIPMNPEEWQHRVSQDKAVLYDHAINGFFGPDDSMMPPRGGNDKLTDKEVRAAVDYMVELATFYIQQNEDLKDDK